MPVTKIKALAKAVRSRDRKHQKKIENFVIIFRFDGKHHAVYFSCPIVVSEKPIKKPTIVSTDPETQVIEIHRASFFPEAKLKKRLIWLDNLIKR